MDSLNDKIIAVRERIERAAARVHRPPESITLVAVTKVFPADAILAGYDAGLRDFGENYVQEFEGKFPRVRQLEGARFHLIGHLQSNKTKRASELFQVIQTVDSAKLATRLGQTGARLHIFVEVKLSTEESKSGVGEHELPQVVQAVRAADNLRLEGLMTVPEWSENPEASRPAFARLRELAAQHHLNQLSMGMSNDFEVAIEEGATTIRVGTALFGRRVRP